MKCHFKSLYSAALITISRHPDLLISDIFSSVSVFGVFFSTVALLASGAQSQPSPVISPIPLSAVTRYQDQVIIDIMTDLSTALTHKLKALIYFDLARVSQPCRDIFQNLILFNNR